MMVIVLGARKQQESRTCEYYLVKSRLQVTFDCLTLLLMELA